VRRERVAIVPKDSGAEEIVLYTLGLDTRKGLELIMRCTSKCCKLEGAELAEKAVEHRSGMIPTNQTKMEDHGSAEEFLPQYLQ